MPTSVGPNTKGEENLVFGFDTGDTVNSYKGQPIHNVVRPLDEWEVSSRINIEEVSGSDWDSPVPGARMWKCYYSSSIAANSLTRDSNSSNPLLISGSFGKSLYLYSMWVRGFDTNPSNSSINIDVHDQNVLNKSIADSQWKKLAVINSDENTGHPTYLFHDLQVFPTNSTKVDFLITGLMLARSSGSTYQELTPVTNTNIQWLPEGSIREVDGSLVDLTGNSTLDLTNVSFDSTAQITFDGTDDRIEDIGPVHSRLSSSATEVIFAAESLPSSGYAMVFGYKHVGGNYSKFTTAPVTITDAGKVFSSVITTTETYRTVTSTTTISTGQYNHVVLNKDVGSGTLELYVNGNLESSVTFDTDTYAQWPSTGSYIGTDRLEIGGLTTTATWSKYLDGPVPIGKLYSRTLTASEIKANYNAIKGRFNI